MSKEIAGVASSCTDSTTPSVDLSEDDKPDDKPLAQTIGKGKKRLGAVTRAGKEANTSSGLQRSQARPDEKLLKTIKQEKLS